MRVEVYSDKFVTHNNPSGRQVVDTSDPRMRKLLGARVIEELESGAEVAAPPAATQATPPKRKKK
ncbi:MAG TPA: hypothetical protein PK280_12440 [Planctomycetota bacterium]|nr:hypothetical protein [Planctomycetota bacterium]